MPGVKLESDSTRAAAKLALVALLALASAAGLAHEHRSRAVRESFERHHPCPANGHRHGACPGYVVDHVKPLCAGGPDATSNMQWQTVQAGKAKDRIERRMCRHRRH